MAVSKLRIHEPNKAPREIDLVPGLTIGRAPTNRCVLEDAAASGEHARIVEIGGALVIQDVGSANKTRVDGGPALAKDQHARLTPGMRFTIGGTKLEVVGDEDDGADATQQRMRATPTEEDTDLKTLARARTGAAPKAGAPEEQEGATLKRSPAPAPQAARGAPVLRPAPSASAPASAPPTSAATRAFEAAKRAREEAKPVPDRPTSGADLDVDEAGMTAPVASPEFEPALLQATISEAKPRLVFRAKKQGAVVAIKDPVQVLGRRQVGDVAVAIDDDGVSSRHARLSLSGRTFWIEDLESKNHTHLDKEQIAPKVKRALRGDSWLRFGTVDVLFVTENVAGMESPDGAMYDEAVTFMAETGALAGESLKQARAARRAGKHPAVDLIVSGAISVPQWHDAISTAKLRVRANSSGRKGNRNTLLVAGLGALVLILVVVVVWMLTSK